MECKLDKITVNYKICGEGRPLLMIHGYYPDHRLMEGCMEPIFAQRSGWQRIYIDLPGMGETKGESWINNSDDMLKVVAGFVEKVIPKRHFSVAGESYGGYLAQGLTAIKGEQIDGMVLICPVVVADNSKRNLPKHHILVNDPELMASLTKEAADEFGSMAVVQNQWNWVRYRDEIIPGLMTADKMFLQRIQNHGYEFSMNILKQMKPFYKPVLILTGRQDSSVGYRDAWNIVENYPRGTYTVLDMAGHNLQIEQETLFNALVSDWLNRIEMEDDKPLTRRKDLHIKK